MGGCQHGRFLRCVAAGKGSPGVRLFLSAAILSAALLPGGSIAGTTGLAAPAANLLLLNAYHLGYRWSDEVVDGVRETLSARAPRTQLFVEHLDSKRIFRPAAIVLNMLSFARKSDRIVSSHDLRVLMDEAEALAQTDYDMKEHCDFRQIQIVRQYTETLDPVPCEKSKLQQVFSNPFLPRAHF